MYVHKKKEENRLIKLFQKVISTSILQKKERKGINY